MSEVKTDSVVNVSGDNDSGIDLSTNDMVKIKTANTERMRINSSGNVGISNTSPTQKLSIGGDASGTVVLQVTNSTAGTAFNDGMQMFINDSAGGLNMREAYPLQFYVNGSERMRIDSGGNVLVNQSSSTTPGVGNTTAGFALNSGNLLCVSRSGDTAVSINRSSDDGTLIDFRQAGTGEGSISVSGTTVSYNGGHLSRWSQATDGNRIDGLVKGTVMTNLDQMAEWTKDGVTEDNEQLNCMAVSSVEGDANVAGVFVNWDEEEDGFNDMNIAMTGDMVIRIAQDTTVARGDLLMSAGDGTAKPQDDDIVRSKTIAKVTSTTVSHTYDDGSYLVPCVLMAC